ncbi:hypothetical protein ACWCWD_26740 [Streptomyces sp. NPDC001493]
MDAELATLATTAGSALLNALTTDLWRQAQTSVAALWRRAHPERADTVEASLTETRTLLLTAPESEEAQISAEQWRLNFRLLLARRPDLVDELRRVVADELEPLAAPTPPQNTSTVFHATASGHGRVYQSAGDQTINER